MTGVNGAGDGAVSRVEGDDMRVRMVIAYDGTDFRGLAKQPNVRTVIGELERVLDPFGDDINIVMSGRTDAGVHGWGQVLSFDLPADANLARIQKSVNSRLGPEVVARRLEAAEPDFHARFDATGRHYRYRVLNRRVPDPFLARLAWHVRDPLDVGAMNAAAAHFIGLHDFTSFCRMPKKGPEYPPVVLERTLRTAVWTEIGDGELLFEISGSAFCHQMVRSIVGFLASVGLGKRHADEVLVELAARDRSNSEPLAPPHGLTLWQVDYAGGNASAGPAASERYTT